MGAGIATFDGCSIEWTVLYDEVIVVLEGTFRLVVGKDSAFLRAGRRDLDPGEHADQIRGRQGQGVLRPAIPVDWRQKHAMCMA